MTTPIVGLPGGKFRGPKGPPGGASADFAGIFDPTKSYPMNVYVSLAAAGTPTYISNRATVPGEVPGDASEAWQFYTPPGEKGEKGDKGEKGNDGDPGEKGDQGFTGSRGPAGSIVILGVSSLDSNEQPSVTNEGTPEAARLRIGIPKGDRGERGFQGLQGPPGEASSGGSSAGGFPVAFLPEATVSLPFIVQEPVQVTDLTMMGTDPITGGYIAVRLRDLTESATLATVNGAAWPLRNNGTLISGPPSYGAVELAAGKIYRIEISPDSPGSATGLTAVLALKGAPPLSGTLVWGTGSAPEITDANPSGLLIPAGFSNYDANKHEMVLIKDGAQVLGGWYYQGGQIVLSLSYLDNGTHAYRFAIRERNTFGSYLLGPSPDHNVLVNLTPSIGNIFVALESDPYNVSGFDLAQPGRYHLDVDPVNNIPASSDFKLRWTINGVVATSTALVHDNMQFQNKFVYDFSEYDTNYIIRAEVLRNGTEVIATVQQTKRTDPAPAAPVELTWDPTNPEEVTANPTTFAVIPAEAATETEGFEWLVLDRYDNNEYNDDYADQYLSGAVYDPRLSYRDNGLRKFRVRMGNDQGQIRGELISPEIAVDLPMPAPEFPPSIEVDTWALMYDKVDPDGWYGSNVQPGDAAGITNTQVVEFSIWPRHIPDDATVTWTFNDTTVIHSGVGQAGVRATYDFGALGVTDDYASIEVKVVDGSGLYTRYTAKWIGIGSLRGQSPGGTNTERHTYIKAAYPVITKTSSQTTEGLADTFTGTVQQTQYGELNDRFLYSPRWYLNGTFVAAPDFDDDGVSTITITAPREDIYTVRMDIVRKSDGLIFTRGLKEWTVYAPGNGPPNNSIPYPSVSPSSPTSVVGEGVIFTATAPEEVSDPDLYMFDWSIGGSDFRGSTLMNSAGVATKVLSMSEPGNYWIYIQIVNRLTYEIMVTQQTSWTVTAAPE